jgi:riboflavin synthase
MFTGIIQDTGKIKRIVRKGSGRQIVIECRDIQSDIKPGASIACNGICLTVTSFDRNEITLEAMEETISRTTLSYWQTGERINLERGVMAGSNLDGHIVQGHVDSISNVLRIERREASKILEIAIPEGYGTLIVDKGSIALNGVSLTVASIKAKSFTVSLVGYTLEQTNLNDLKPGSRLNIEFDIIGKYITRYLDNRASQLTEEKIREEGF